MAWFDDKEGRHEGAASEAEAEALSVRYACAAGGYGCCAKHHAAREAQRLEMQKEGKRKPAIFIAIECTCLCHKEFQAHRKDEHGEYPFSPPNTFNAHRPRF
jgi:hypothetical protein